MSFITKFSSAHLHPFSKPSALLLLSSIDTSKNRSFCHFVSAFDAKTAKDVEMLHAKAIKDGTFIRYPHVRSCFLNVYLRCCDFANARKLFDEIPERDVRMWTVLLSGFSRKGYSSLALELFREMIMEGVYPNRFTLSSVLKGCSSLCGVTLGKEIHGWVIRNGIDIDVVLANSILNVYAKCGELCLAERLFGMMGERDSVSWNIILAAYLEIGELEKSLELFESCLFKDVASWNTMIDGLMGNGFEGMAVELLYRMVESGPMFSEFTFSVSLVLASYLSTLELGKQIHARILRLGVGMDSYLRNSLIQMYSKCGSMEKASLIFNQILLNAVRADENPTITYDQKARAKAISWSSMVSGHVQNGKFLDALRIFRSMVLEQLEVDKYTLTSIVSACANSGMLELGCQVHAYSHKIGHELDAHLGSSLIDMYAKCGSLCDAKLIFEQTKDVNVVMWTSIITAYALHGHGMEATWLFEQMINEGTSPNEITFVAVLTACSHGGLLEEGRKYFRLMKDVYNIEPGIEHFTCMIDIYGRAGLLNEAKDFISENNISHIDAVWKSLLSSCRLHKNTEMGSWVTEQLLQLEPLNEGPYLLLSNICAAEHRWEEAARVRYLMRKRGIKKHPAKSWI